MIQVPNCPANPLWNAGTQETRRTTPSKSLFLASWFPALIHVQYADAYGVPTHWASQGDRGLIAPWREWFRLGLAFGRGDNR